MTSAHASDPTSIRRHAARRRASLSRPCCRTLVIGAILIGAAGCGSSDDTDIGRDAAVPADEGASSSAAPRDDATDEAATGIDPAAAPATELADGPVTVVALGDSLTYGEGDDTGLGFVGRLTESIGAMPGREGSSLVNLGVSGWHSTGMVEGQDGSPAQLPAAVDAVTAAVADGRAALATVLIGSNDMWFLYAYGAPEGTSPAEEDAAEETFRSNLDRTVSELSQAGAVVVLGLPDDQSLRPIALDLDALNAVVSEITAEEIQQMSAMSERLDRVVEEVAAGHGVRTVDTNAPFWADESTMAPDLIHPNADGYTILADLWIPVIDDLL